VKYFSGVGNLMTFHEFRLVAAHQTIIPMSLFLSTKAQAEPYKQDVRTSRSTLLCLHSVRDGFLIGRTTGIPSVFLTQRENRIRPGHRERGVCCHPSADRGRRASPLDLLNHTSLIVLLLQFLTSRSKLSRTQGRTAQHKRHS
jgi:hypothetical protein